MTARPVIRFGVQTGRSWLWPDHAITKADSRWIREEHNALVNDYNDMLEACRVAIARMHPFTDMQDECAVLRAAIEKAEGGSK